MSKIDLLYCYNTKVGMFYIGVDRDGFSPIFASQLCGVYVSAAAAAAGIAADETTMIPGDMKVCELGIPSDLSKWTKMRNFT